MPLKVNMAGVIPVIFAASLMMILPTFTQFVEHPRRGGLALAHFSGQAGGPTSSAKPC